MIQSCWNLVQVFVAQLRAAKREAKAAASLILQQELKSRRRVLRRLGCVACLAFSSVLDRPMLFSTSASFCLQLAQAWLQMDAAACHTLAFSSGLHRHRPADYMVSVFSTVSGPMPRT